MISEQHESIRVVSPNTTRRLLDRTTATTTKPRRLVARPIHKVWERSVWNDDTEEWKLPNLKPKKEFSNVKLPPMGGDDGGGGGGGKELTAEEVEKKRRRRERKEKEREKVRFFSSCWWFVFGFGFVFSWLDLCSFSWLEVTHTPPARVV